MSFASGLVAPADYKGLLPAQDVTLSAGSTAVDRGTVIPGVNPGGAAATAGRLDAVFPRNGG
jgi:hypothetical protein